MSRKLSNMFPEDEVKEEVKAGASISELKNEIMGSYEQRSKKKTVEDTHTRTTFLLRNDLIERLDNLSEGKRGFKTMFFNKAVEAILNEIEESE